jgi:hypothetical protein
MLTEHFVESRRTIYFFFVTALLPFFATFLTADFLLTSFLPADLKSCESFIKNAQRIR